MKKSIAITALTLMSGTAMAGFEAERIGFMGVNNAFQIDNTANGGGVDTFRAGQFLFQYTDVGGDRGIGQFAGGTFTTFCIELQFVVNGPQPYDINEISDAPDPSPGPGGPQYDQADENEVNAVIAAAIGLGWLNYDISVNTATNAQLAAVQGMIWEVVLDSSVVTVINAGVAAELTILQAAIALDPNATTPFLFAMTSADSQDQLFMVPMPMAAWAGLFTLGGLAGVKRLRRR